MKPPTVSFDFDGTLSRSDVQNYAAELIAQGVDVRVTTTRYDDMHSHKYGMDFPNILDDLWEVVDRLGIARYKVRFTNMMWKYTYFKGTSFVFHLDDNEQESTNARYESCTVPMIILNSKSWKRKCNQLIKNYRETFMTTNNV
jgi:hypothetical protein